MLNILNLNPHISLWFEQLVKFGVLPTCGPRMYGMQI